jgi:UDP-GlcNAc:undecaprenyl-phosphate/decaprenyl-phosphate GlcNAc-1-phosphate transferase
VVSLSLVLLGACCAFLLVNFPPAKIFMGDSGAYFLAYFLVVLTMAFSETGRPLSIIGPALIVGIPIIDGIFTNIRRLFAGKSIFLGDREHLYDRLLQKGFSERKTLCVMYSLQAVLVLLGVYMVM